ncbi:MAG: NAD-dependent epimerase/dehydratase family protein [Patescibacteria group bacterium]
MPKNSTKVIVTGGAGFIGSHLTDALIKAGYSVHVIDNLVAGKKENINPRAVFYKADIRQLKKIKPVFDGASYVFHLAALPRVQPSIKNPKTTHDINVTGTLNVLIAARDVGVKRVIYAASSSAYGNQKKFPLKESFPADPISPYGLQKYMGELQCRLFSQLYKLETVSLRYFNVYGPRFNADGAYSLVVGRFLKQRQAGQALTIVPDGNQSRDFTHVYDVVRANLLAMKSKKIGWGGVINIGGGNDQSVNKVATLIGGPAVFVEPRLEPRRTLADISLAKELLGWEPRIKFEEGVAELKRLYLS